MKQTMTQKIVCAAVVTMLAVAPVFGTLLEYEGFNMSGTNLHGQVGSGSGWGTNAWFHPGGPFQLSNDGISLNYPTGVPLTETGSRLNLTAGTAATNAEIRLGTPMNLALASSNFYASFLLQKLTPGGSVTFGFMDDSANIRWRVSAISTNFWVGASGINMGDGLVVGETYFVVTRVLTQSGSANDSFFMNVYGPGDPIPMTEPTTWETTRLEVSNVNLTRMLVVASNTTAFIDEIRIGTTWMSVVPEPGTISLVLGGLALIGAARLRRIF